MPASDYRGAELCNAGKGHEFEGGLCVHCLAAAAPEYDQRAMNAYDHYLVLKQTFSAILGRYLTDTEARMGAWRSHRDDPKP